MNDFIGIWCGPDGKPSGRRIFGTVFFAASIGLLFMEQINGVKGWFDLAPSIVAGLLGCILWGFITVDKIVETISKKGQ